MVRFAVVPDDDRPNYARPAPPTVASPVDMLHPPDATPMWYLPEWSERLRFMGWRVLLFIPAALMILFFLGLPFWPWGWQLILPWWKLWVIAIALPLGAAAQAARHALRLRKDPFCIHCGYSVTGLPDGHNCPECGSRFDLKVIEEYRRDPHWFIERYKQRHDVPPPQGGIAAGKSLRKSRDGT